MEKKDNLTSQEPKKLEEILGDLNEYIKENKPDYLYNQKFIPGKSQVLYSGPYWDEYEIMAAINTFVKGKWVVAGENVYKFERKFAKMFGAKYAQMVNSGSSANLVLIAGLKKYFGWEDDDEVIVSPVGFPTTISTIVQNRLKPVFVDIEYDTLNFDITKIEKKITDKTKAIFVSPVLGNVPDMDFLKELCDRRGIQLVGDSCDSLGSKWDGKHLSDYYVAWSSSFYPAHHISTGEGGIVCTNIVDLKKNFTSFAWWGRDCYCVGSANLLYCGTCGKRFDNWLETYDGIIDHKYVFTNMGYNLKPMDLQGSIGLVQLTKFEEIDTKRKISKNRVENILLNKVEGLSGVKMLDKADTCWFGTPFICKDKTLKNKLVTFLEENKIQTRNYFAGNILMHPGYKHLGDYNNYPNGNQVLDKVFFLGAAPHYDDQVFDYIENVFEEKWVN
jgi:CDP-6-deoxy-D-xylo-4-hexulose-3-dehydrase